MLSDFQCLLVVCMIATAFCCDRYELMISSAGCGTVIFPFEFRVRNCTGQYEYLLFQCLSLMFFLPLVHRAGAPPAPSAAGRGLRLVVCGPASARQKSPVAASREARPERAPRALVPHEDGVAGERAPRQRVRRDRGRFDAGQWGHPPVQAAPEARQPRLGRLLPLHEGPELDG